jgi:heat shock protein HtpX
MIWQQIRSNRIRSFVLVGGMGLFLLALGYLLGLLFAGEGIFGLIVAFVVWGILTLIAFFQGDSILLSISKARKIGPGDNPRLYNIVEEMKIASGLPRMPDVYVVDDAALNAFATGRDINHASVAVTSGLLQKLNRDELQGVIAHEISHIKNRDVLLMTLAGIVVGTIVILSWYGSRFLFLSGASGGRRSSSEGGGGGAAQLIIIVVGLVLLILAPIAAYLIYFALSRRREYLADASGALYTRYPEGLASALEKLAASTAPVQAANQATAPMYIVNPFRKQGRAAADLTSTHPPISERVRILRTMAGNYSMDAYDQAYRTVHGKGHVVPPGIPGTPLTPSGTPPSGSSGAALVGAGNAPVMPQPLEVESQLERTRSTGDMIWRMNNYKTMDCECGTKMKIPPGFKGTAVRCPHCGRVNTIDRAPPQS